MRSRTYLTISSYCNFLQLDDEAFQATLSQVDGLDKDLLQVSFERWKLDRIDGNFEDDVDLNHEAKTIITVVTIRELKVQGTSKVGGYCTAHMTVSEDTVTKQVTFLYCNHHKCHETEICHLPIPEETKLSIAAKLQSGVSIEG